MSCSFQHRGNLFPIQSVSTNKHTLPTILETLIHAA